VTIKKQHILGRQEFDISRIMVNRVCSVRKYYNVVDRMACRWNDETIATYEMGAVTNLGCHGIILRLELGYIDPQLL
jgi:hypothetical protein